MYWECIKSKTCNLWLKNIFQSIVLRNAVHSQTINYPQSSSWRRRLKTWITNIEIWMFDWQYQLTPELLNYTWNTETMDGIKFSSIPSCTVTQRLKVGVSNTQNIMLQFISCLAWCRHSDNTVPMLVDRALIYCDRVSHGRS